MPTRIQTLRSSLKGVRPTAGSREVGELYVNFPDRQIGVINASKNPIDLVAVRFFSTTADYVAGDYVVQAGQLYRALNAIVAGAFNPNDWVAVSMVPADLLNAIKLVDGAGSGLDADLLDGFDSSAFAFANAVAATYAPLNDPVFTGNPRITTTPPNTDSDTSIASTAFVKSVRLDMFAQPIASVGMNNQQITGMSAPSNPNDAANKAYVDAAVSSGSAIPPGQVGWFATAAAPAGWLKANGSTVSRATYAALFAAIGTTFGAGDGSTTFTLPDLRGEFVRGFDDGRAVDAGRALGSAQTDNIKATTTGGESVDHTHAMSFMSGDDTPDHAHTYNYRNAAANAGTAAPTAANYWNAVIVTTSAGATARHQHAINGATVGRSAAHSHSFGAGTETRPRNVALLACIKT